MTILRRAKNCIVLLRSPIPENLPPEVHAAVAMAAEVSGKSINQWAAEALVKAASR